MYQNGGGQAIEDALINRLSDLGISTLRDLNLGSACSKMGQTWCNGTIMEHLDLFFSYNAGEQTPYQVHLYEAISKAIPTINSFDAFRVTEDKYFTSTLLAREGIPTSDFRLIHRDDVAGLKKAVQDWNGQVVYKPVEGWGGAGIFKIEDERSVDVLVPFIQRLDLPHLYLERFVNYDKTDFRVDIVNGEFIGCYGRQAPEDDWKTNITSGGRVILKEPNDRIIELSLAAANAVGADIAGVDIIYDLDANDYLVLEVNGIPAFATPEQEAMGINFNERKIDAIVKLIDQRIQERS
jgi:ribosomal protein S6--L-glutamate ligase